MSCFSLTKVAFEKRFISPFYQTCQALGKGDVAENQRNQRVKMHPL